MLWKIPVTWEMCAYIKVEADTLDEAMKIAEDPDGKIPLPTDGSYVDGSWVLSSTDREEIAILQEPTQTAGGYKNESVQAADSGRSEPAQLADALQEKASIEDIIAYNLPGFYLDCRGVYGIMVFNYYISCIFNDESRLYDVKVETLDEQGDFSSVKQWHGFKYAEDAVKCLRSMVKSYEYISREDLLDELNNTYGGEA